MPLHKKLFVVSVLLIFTPLVLLFADATLMNCLDQTKIFPHLLGFADTWIPTTLKVLPVGFGVLLVAFVFEKKFQGTDLKKGVSELLLLIILGLVCGSLVLASLNSARSKGPNAKIKTSVSVTREEAEMLLRWSSSDVQRFL